MQSKIRIAAVVVALTGLAWTGYWVAAKVWLRGAITDWAAAREAEGFTVGFIEQDITGFPFALEAYFPAPTLGRLDDTEPWVWMPDRIDIALRPWAFDRARIQLPTEQRFSRLDSEGRVWLLTLHMASGEANVVFSGDALDRLDVEARGVAFEAPPGDGRIGRLTAHGRRGPDGAALLTLTLDDITLPPGAGAGLGRGIARLFAEAMASGPLPRTPDAAGLDAWRVAGGAIDVSRLEIDWGPLSVSADGTLALDDALRPLAALTAQIVGFGAALKALAAAGVVKQRDASLATIALNLIAKTDAEGRRVLIVPVTAQNGILMVGPITIARLAPVLSR
jgi:hypothetical protein